MSQENQKICYLSIEDLLQLNERIKALPDIQLPLGNDVEVTLNDFDIELIYVNGVKTLVARDRTAKYSLFNNFVEFIFTEGRWKIRNSKLPRNSVQAFVGELEKLVAGLQEKQKTSN